MDTGTVIYFYIAWDFRDYGSGCMHFKCDYVWETIYDELLSREDIQLNEYDCTSNCSLCARQLFVVVSEEVIKAKSEDQLRD